MVCSRDPGVYTLIVRDAALHTCTAVRVLTMERSAVALEDLLYPVVGTF